MKLDLSHLKLYYKVTLQLLLECHCKNIGIEAEKYLTTQCAIKITKTQSKIKVKEKKEM